MAELTRPPLLRTFLDVGCDITTLPGWEVLAEGVVLSAPGDREQRRDRARYFRSLVESWLAGDLNAEDVDQSAVTCLAWEAECLEDEDLAERLEASLPVETRANLLLWKVEMLWPEATE